MKYFHRVAKKEASHKWRALGGNEDSDDNDKEDLDAVDWEQINTHMNKIYAKNLTLIKYNRHLPEVQEWARALVSLIMSMSGYQMDRKDGVSPTSPPSSLHHISLKGAKKVRIEAESVNSTSTPDFKKLGPSVTSLTQDQLALIAEPVSYPPNKSHIGGYINFLGIRNKENVLNKLIANGFHSHKLLKSAGLLHTNVSALGLTLGVVTVLFDNVHKYEHHLANQV
ncbi:hypothetical protein VP01_2405g1 [Puccinia sorghi]|uniref:Uncharacterized protein n=1 Tax=Puccinia sorghi TaxID=27349 RepID=A0A0L6V6U0_9BASI|nr:hypothetical protein VP01_2405g1 [Puccinia sorghi]